MKNIFLVRTGAPTRLYKNGQGVFELRDKEERVTDETSQNYWMYIVTEEAFSEGDFITDNYVQASRVRSTTIGALKENGCYEQFKKVILTTHGYLINEGIQHIDDNFLEWFVKNPSCEEVVVDKPISRGVPLLGYKIIIPQEEPNFLEVTVNAFKKSMELNLELESETLEEAEKEFEKLINGKALPTKQLTEVAEHYFIVGYEIGQEKMYSEEEVIKLLIDCKDRFGDSDLNAYTTDGEVKKWFEQFKKK